MVLTNLLLYNVGSFHVNFSFSGAVVLQKIFEIVSSLVAPPAPGAHDLNKL
jgi:hypothetical protein